MAAIGWMAAIFYWSSLSNDAVSTVGPYDAAIFGWLGLVKSVVAHLVIYGVLACLIQAAIWSWKPNGNHSLRIAWAAAALAGVYGVSDVFHQLLVIGRSASWLDVVTNAGGAAAAAMAMCWLIRSLSPYLRLRWTAFKPLSA